MHSLIDKELARWADYGEALEGFLRSREPRRLAGLMESRLTRDWEALRRLIPLIGGLASDTFGYSSAFFITSAMLVLAGLLVAFGVDEKFEPLLSLTRSPLAFLKDWRAIIRGPGVSMSYGMRFISQLGRTMILPLLPLFIAGLLVEQTGSTPSLD